MGISSSLSVPATRELSVDIENFKDVVWKEAQIVGNLASLTYSKFLDMLKELNTLFMQTTDANGKSLLFVKKGGSDTTIFWKATVRIVCVRTLHSTGQVEECKYLNLKQFMKAYNVIIYHIKPMLNIQPVPKSKSRPIDGLESTDDEFVGNASDSSFREFHRNPLSTSMILKTIGGQELDIDIEECCICMERKPEVTLPCAHSYCLFCIEQWNVSNKTCPVCREAVENTDDSWVLPEIPESSEVSAEMQRVLRVLTSKLPEEP